MVDGQLLVLALYTFAYDFVDFWISLYDCVFGLWEIVYNFAIYIFRKERKYDCPS